MHESVEAERGIRPEAALSLPALSPTSMHLAEDAEVCITVMSALVDHSLPGKAFVNHLFSGALGCLGFKC